MGPVRRGDVVTILEDTTTTGGALVEAVDVALEAGLTVIQAISLFDRSGGTVAELMGERGIPYSSLATPSDLGVEE